MAAFLALLCFNPRTYPQISQPACQACQAPAKPIPIQKAAAADVMTIRMMRTIMIMVVMVVVMKEWRQKQCAHMCKCARSMPSPNEKSKSSLSH